MRKHPTKQGWLHTAQTTVTHKTVTSQLLMSYDLVLLHADLWHCSGEASNLRSWRSEAINAPSCRPATEKSATAASFKLFRLDVCVLLQRFLLTVSTTEQLSSTAALLRRDVSDTECTVALSCCTEPSSNLLAVICSVAQDVSLLSADSCVATDNVAPASCVVTEERCTEHQTRLSRMTSNDPTLLRPTPHVPNSNFPH